MDFSGVLWTQVVSSGFSWCAVFVVTVVCSTLDGERLVLYDLNNFQRVTALGA